MAYDDDIIAFIKARLDEDEAAAKAWLPFGNPDAAAREHIARQDPGRVLREVEAKREIIRVCGRVYVLRCLAAVYSDHPDYRQEWALLSTSEERASSSAAPRSPS